MAALSPQRDTAWVRAELSLTSEGVRVLAQSGRQPYHDLPDLRETLPAARVSGNHLDPRALLDVASFAEGAHEISFRVARAEDAPRLSEAASRVKDATALAAVIRRAILPSGEVSDDASPRLGELRRTLLRLRSSLHSLMESYLRDKDADRLLQDKLVTLRNDRYVLVVKSEMRSALPGIIHGNSGSGASVFVEPLPAVELNNDIVSLQEDERQEVVRILKALTAAVAERASDLEQAGAVLGELDFVQARALLAQDMGALEPEITDSLDLELIRARHPLLIPALAQKLGNSRKAGQDVVPVTLRVGSASPVLVISGPNTGGKTVALKTLGLFALMAQSGLHVSAELGSRLPVFQRVFADIGDDQSIAENLSTFSAHLQAIVEMTRDLKRKALVLLDEVGAGTDPTEGGGLGVAIVEHFRREGAMVVATTHHGLMKAYAQSTPGVACAAFGYVPTTWEPNYQLTYGTAGRSLALEMAEKLGLPAAVVQDARSRLDVKQAQAEALLQKLELEEALLRKERQELEEKRAVLKGEAQRLKEREREVALTRRAETEAFARDLKKRGDEAARQATEAISKAVKQLETRERSSEAAALRARSAALAGIREAQSEAAKGLLPETGPALNAAPLTLGGKARLKDLKLVGEVVGFHGDDVDLLVMGKRVRTPRGSVIGLAGGPGASSSGAPGRAGRGISAAAVVASASAAVAFAPRTDAAEIHVIGLSVDEALPRVDKALDDAALHERTQLRVVHGFGQGRLRKAVADLLDGHPHVASFHSAAQNQGGAGVTLVELRS